MGGCDVTITNYQSSFLTVAKNRAIDLVLAEYNDYLNSTMIQVINDSRTNTNLTKNQDLQSIFTFTAFKWTGISRKSDFKLSAHTLLNGISNSTSSIDDLITTMEEVPISDLMSFVQSSGQIPQGSGLNAATNLYNQVSGQIQASVSGSSSNSMTNLFSNANALKNTFSNLFIANSKAPITSNIYVSSDTDVLEVDFLQFSC